MRKTTILFIFYMATLGLYAQKTSEKGPKELMTSYYNENFNPFQKSNWMISFNMSLEREDIENESYRLENVIKGTQRNSKIEIGGGYFFSDNFSANLGFSIGDNSFNGEISKTFENIDRTSDSKTYGVNPRLRSQIPVVPSKRLSLFVDLGLGFSWGNTKTYNSGRFSSEEKTTSKDYSFYTGIDAGVTFFAIENFAIEIGLDLLSYTYTSNKTDNYEEPNSKYDTHNITFDLDLLSLNLALTYYIGAKKNKS